MTIKTLSIQGYRSIQSLRLSMDAINVFIGANGCGKSNLYKAIYLRLILKLKKNMYGLEKADGQGTP